MKYFRENQWFHSSELLRAVTEIHRRATTEHTHWLGHVDCKYVSLRIDQRLGNFIFQDGSGRKMTLQQVYAMFPALRDPGELLEGEDPICVQVALTGELPG